LNEGVRVEEYYGGVAKKKRGRRERESKQINKDKSGLMAVQEKV
jgi:hypothetical protein